jgi:erythromycin esterase-like protein
MLGFDSTAQAVRREAIPVGGTADVDAVVAAIADARIVLMGEATHGTHEFYRMRAELSRRLIERKGFDAVAVEADWPAALRASRHARGAGGDASTIDALAGFERFPRWMWRNTDVVRWLEWLRAHNATLADPSARVGFFGLDLYSLRESIDAVLSYLAQADPEAARRARTRYACFDHYADEPQAYGHAVSFGMRPDCERQVVQQLAELFARASQVLRNDGDESADELFYAQQNARVVHNAEAYYRSMFGSHTESWNLRDRHMAETLRLLDEHLSGRRGRPARIIVWAHNSHLGDARATQSSERGELNLGQLVREHWTRRGETFSLGFTTHAGTVAAASDWDAPVQLKTVLPSRPDSIERVLHDSDVPRFFLPLRDASPALRRLLDTPRLERAIGVIYRPETERWSHYFDASLASQFDGVVHFDVTRAVRPLDTTWHVEHDAEPETYPFGI